MLASPNSDNTETKSSWLEEIVTLKKPLATYSGGGSIFMEYNIPRMGRRTDVIVLIDGIIFVLEFKTLGNKFSHQAPPQVWDYAIDLKNFQVKSYDRTIIPIVVIPGEKNCNCVMELTPYDDQVYKPTQVNETKLKDLFAQALSTIQKEI